MPIAPATRYNTVLLPLLIIFTGVFYHCNAAATTDSLVTGKYLSSSGAELILNLTIQNPAPANLIVEQFLSSENKVISSSPPAKKVDNSQGNVKWLFKNTKNGILALSIRLSEPLRGNVSAIVRYRSPQSGTFTELRITP